MNHFSNKSESNLNLLNFESRTGEGIICSIKDLSTNLVYQVKIGNEKLINPKEEQKELNETIHGLES